MQVKDTVYAIECDGDIGLHDHLYTYEGAQFALRANLILNAHARQEGVDIDRLILELIEKNYLTIRAIDVLGLTDKEKNND